MSEQNQEAEVKIRLVITGDGAKAINSVTKEVIAATTAEEIYQERLKQRKKIDEENAKAAKQGGTTLEDLVQGAHRARSVSETADRITGSRAHQAAVQREIQMRERAMGIDRESPAYLARQRYEADQKRYAVQKEYEKLTGGGAAGGGGTGGMLGGVGGLAGIVGGGAAASAYLQKAATMEIERGTALANPYLNENLRYSASGGIAGSLRDKAARLSPVPYVDTALEPIVGSADYAMGIGHRLARIKSGEEARFQAAGRTEAEGLVDSQYRARVKNERRTTGADEDLANIRAKTYGSLSLDRMKSNERTKALDEKIYNEELRLLPARQQLTIAAKERVVAERELAYNLSNEREDKDDLESSRRQLAENLKKQLEMGKNSGPGIDIKASMGELYAEETSIRNDIKENEKQYLDSLRRTRESKINVANKFSGERKAQQAVTEGELRNVEGRETIARGQAQNLGGLGRMGRMQGKFALERVQRFGIEGVTPEEVQMAASVAPDTIRELQTASGSKFVPEFRKLAPSDYRDDFDTVRKEADTLRERFNSEREQDSKKYADEMSRAVKGLIDVVIKEFGEQIDAIKSNIGTNARKILNQQS